MIACPVCPVAASPEPGVPTPAIACAICPAAQGSGGPANIACPACPVTPCAMCPMTAGAATPAIACAICPVTSGSTGSEPGSEVTCSNCPLETSCPELPATLTWAFDGTSFQRVDSSASDAPASGGELAWFPGPGLLVDLGADLDAEMGGVSISCPYGAPCPLIPAAEDWQWTGTGWTTVQDLPASAAAPYFEAPPVSDAAAGDVVGLDTTGVTWVSTSPATGWMKASPADAPPALSEPALAYDGATGQVVLFGGELLGSTSVAGEVVGDTWTWDGATWTEQEGGAPTPTASATPMPTTSGVPSLTPVPSASAVAGSPSPSPTAPASASATSTATATATAAAGALPAIAPITG
jgi:hypothetical protein